MHHEWEEEQLAEVEASLRQTLGNARFAELTARGSTLDSVDAVAYVAAQAALALDEP